MTYASTNLLPDPLDTRALPDPKIIHSHLKASAAKRSIEFSLTVRDIYDIPVPLSCPVFGFRLYWHRHKFQDNSFSVDRIDTTQGYVAGNLEYISYLANKCKSNMTSEQLALFCDYYSAK